MSSLIFRAAIDEWRRIRGDYQLWLEAHHAEAVDACNGVLLNKRGREAGVDPFTLFKGPAVRANAYASEELRDFWQRRPRVMFEDFERGYYAMDVELDAAWDESAGLVATHGG